MGENGAPGATTLLQNSIDQLWLQGVLVLQVLILLCSFDCALVAQEGKSKSLSITVKVIFMFEGPRTYFVRQLSAANGFNFDARLC